MRKVIPDLLHLASDVTGAEAWAPNLFDAPAPPERRFTPQEVRLLGLLAEGYSYDGCAAHLNISVNTVRNYIRSVYEKLDVHSKAEAVTKALRSGIIL